MTLPRRWLLWHDDARSGVTNMAADAALLDTVPAGVGVWRWYTWETPTISFGRHERVLGRFDPVRLAAAALPAVRRPTGGRALLHAREFTYSATFRIDETVGWHVPYAAVNEILLAALVAIGIPARLAGASPAVAPEGPVCFDVPSPGEITVHGQKLVGSAVWRQRGAYLQHGSILIHDDQAVLAQVSESGDGTTPLRPAPPAATLAALQPQLDDASRASLVHEALHAQLAARGTVDAFAPFDGFADAVSSQHRHFDSAAWLWRR
jgi:lipoate-protein ligase A